MMSLKQFAAISVSIISLSAASLALADMPYENKAGQSAQMTHAMQRQTEQAVSANDRENNKTFISGTRDTKWVESFRQRNTLGQSDAISKSWPYISLNKNYEVSPKTHLKVETSTYHDANERIGHRLDW